MADTQPLTAAAFVRHQWHPAAALALKEAAAGYLPTVAAEVKAGAAELWEVKGCGWIVTRLEVSNKACLVIVLGAGRNLAGVVGFLAAFSDRCGYAMRIHSIRRGMARLLSPLGFTKSGIGRDGFTIYQRG